ncbi:hypothetical protein [Micromonospora sp. NPDC003241]
MPTLERDDTPHHPVRSDLGSTTARRPPRGVTEARERGVAIDGGLHQGQSPYVLGKSVGEPVTAAAPDDQMTLPQLPQTSPRLHKGQVAQRGRRVGVEVGLRMQAEVSHQPAPTGGQIAVRLTEGDPVNRPGAVVPDSLGTTDLVDHRGQQPFHSISALGHDGGVGRPDRTRRRVPVDTGADGHGGGG